MKEFIKVNVLDKVINSEYVKDQIYTTKLINLNLVDNIRRKTYPLKTTNYVPSIMIDKIDDIDIMLFENEGDRDEMFDKISHATVGIDLNK